MIKVELGHIRGSRQLNIDLSGCAAVKIMSANKYTKLSAMKARCQNACGRHNFPT